MPTKDGRLTRKEKSAINKANYRKVREAVGNRFNPSPGRDKRRKHETLKPHEINGQVKRRARGARTDEDVIKEILELVSTGMTCAEAREVVGLSATQWGGWLREDYLGLKKQYATARALQAEAWSDLMVAEAKTATQNNFQGPKLRIETYKWLAGKHNLVYADKSTHVLEGGDKPIRTVSSTMTEDEAAEAYAALIKQG